MGCRLCALAPFGLWLGISLPVQAQSPQDIRELRDELRGLMATDRIHDFELQDWLRIPWVLDYHENMGANDYIRLRDKIAKEMRLREIATRQSPNSPRPLGSAPYNPTLMPPGAFVPNGPTNTFSSGH